MIEGSKGAETRTTQLLDILGVEVFPDEVSQKTAFKHAKKMGRKKFLGLKKQEKLREIRKIYHPVWKADYVLKTKSKSISGRAYIDAVTGELLARRGKKTVTSHNLFAFMKLNGLKRKLMYHIAKHKELSASELASRVGLPRDAFQANVAGLVEKTYVSIVKDEKNPKIRLRVPFILPESILEDSLLEIQKVKLRSKNVPMDRVIEPSVSPEYAKAVLSTFRDIEITAVDLVFRPVWNAHYLSNEGERTVSVDAF